MADTRSRPPCDLILVSWNHLRYTQACLESLMQCTRFEEARYRLLIVDNGSEPEVVDYLKGFQASHPHVELICNTEDLGWVRAVNQGIERSTAPYLCWLSNDLVFTDGWLTALLDVAAAHPRIGVLNPSWKFHDETPETFQQRIAGQSREGAVSYREVGECNGACMLVRRDVIDRIGRLDDVYASGGLDDADYSRRAAQAGFLCVQVNGAFVYHWENVSVNTMEGYWERERPQKRQIFEARWGPPRSIAVVCDGPDAPVAGVEHPLETIVGLVRLGIRIQLFVLGGLRPSPSQLPPAWEPLEINHAELKVRWLGGWMGSLRCVAILASQRGKHEPKRFKSLVVLSSRGRRVLEGMRWLHGIPIVRSLAACPWITRELEWHRALSAPGRA